MATSKVNCKVYLLLLIYHYVLTIVVYAWEKGGYHHGWRQLSLCLLTICRRYLHIQPSTISDTTWDTLVAMNRTITSSISATTWDYLVASSPSYLLVKANTNRTTIKNPEITYILESTDQINEICTNKYGITCIINIITQIISPPNNGESLEKLFLNHYHPSMNSMIFNSATISTTNPSLATKYPEKQAIHVANVLNMMVIYWKIILIKNKYCDKSLDKIFSCATITYYRICIKKHYCSNADYNSQQLFHTTKAFYMMKVLLPYFIILKRIYNGESLPKYLSYYTLIYNSITTSNTKL